MVTSANKKCTHETEIPRGYHKKEGKEFGRAGLIKSGVERLLCKSVVIRPMAGSDHTLSDVCRTSKDPSRAERAQHRSSNLGNLALTY